MTAAGSRIGRTSWETHHAVQDTDRGRTEVPAAGGEGTVNRRTTAQRAENGAEIWKLIGCGQMGVGGDRGCLREGDLVGCDSACGERGPVRE